MAGDYDERRYRRDYDSDYDDHERPYQPRVAPGKLSRVGRVYGRIDRAAESAAPVQVDPERIDAAARSSGQALPDALRVELEQSIGADLSGVRIHTDSASGDAAQSIAAKAYTTGSDIFFAPGTYDPGSDDGQRLIAHEVAHTVQQSGAPASTAQAKLELSTPGDSCEVEADRFADAFVDRSEVPRLQASVTAPVARKEKPGAPAKHNAKMKVEALSADGRTIAVWENPAFFKGKLPITFETKGPPWELKGAAKTLRVDSDATGTSGRDLVRWIQPYEKQGARVLRVRVTALQGADAGAAPAVDYRPDIEMEPIEISVDAMERDFLRDIQGGPDGAADGNSERDRAGVVDGTDNEVGGSMGHGQGQALSDATDVSGGGVSSKGSRAGHADGSDSPSWTGGGRPDVEGGRLGSDDGKSGGMHSGSADGRGAVGADGGWLKQWIDTPDLIAPLLTAGIIIWEANPADLGKQWLMKAMKSGGKGIGKAVKKAAKDFAKKKVKKLANEVRHAPGLSPEDIKKKLAQTEAALEDEYTRATKQGIQQQLEDREATLGKLIDQPLPDPDIQAHMRHNLEDLQELRREILEDFPDLPARKTARPHLEIPGATKELNGFLGENFSEVTHFGGMKVYKRNDIDLTLVDDKGLTNLERMKAGRPPLGADRQALEVHHLLMSNDGPVVELTNSLHKKHYKTLHINDNKTGSGIARSEFGAWRDSWWKQRAKELGGE